MEEKYPQIVDKIMYKRQRGKKGSKYVDLDVFREYKNRIIAKERARVEHIFAALKRIFKFTRLRCRGLERFFLILLILNIFVTFSANSQC